MLEDWFREDAIAYGEEHCGESWRCAWMVNGWLPGETEQDLLDHRIITVCLLAAMVEAGDA